MCGALWVIEITVASLLVVRHCLFMAKAVTPLTPNISRLVSFGIAIW